MCVPQVFRNNNLKKQRLKTMDSISVLFLGELMLRLSPENGRVRSLMPQKEPGWNGAEFCGPPIRSETILSSVRDPL